MYPDLQLLTLGRISLAGQGVSATEAGWSAGSRPASTA
jgi:hypothetical protein